MFGGYEFDKLIAREDIQRAGYPLEAEDALAAWEDGAPYVPAWYMELSDGIRHVVESLNQNPSK